MSFQYKAVTLCDREGAAAELVTPLIRIEPRLLILVST